MSEKTSLGSHALDKESHLETESLQSYGSSASKSRKHGSTAPSRFRWESKSDFIIVTMASTFSMFSFDTFVTTAISDDIGIVQYSVWGILFCLPLCYMQLLLGQYTQLGTILFKHLSPIGHGVGFVLISNIFLRTIKHSLLLNDSMVYFISSFRSNLQWMNCSRQYNIPCWDSSKSCTNCVNSTYYMPGYIYFFIHYLQDPVLDPAKIKLALPPMRKLMTHLVCWLLTCLVLMIKVVHYVKTVKIIWITYLILLVFLILGCVIPEGRRNFSRLFYVRPDTLTSISSWCNALGDTIILFGLGRAFHVVHGSFMGNQSPVGLLSIIFVVINFIMTCSTSILTIACIDRIAHYTKTDDDHLHEISWSPGINTYFYVLPQGLGYMGVPQLWSCIYFATCILMNVNLLLTHLITIEKSLSDFYPNLIRYRKYIIGIFCIFSALISSLLLSREAYLIKHAICFKMLDCGEMFTVVALCVLVCWIYGVQRFCDDIHFITGRQTTKFWKICWYILPLLALVAHVQVVITQFSSLRSRVKTMDILLLFIFSSPIAIMAIIQVFKFMRKRDLLSLFQPQERFGPPDPVERQLRRLFNPRMETKSRRRTQMCTHPCLVNSKVLKVIIEDEDLFREKYKMRPDTYDIDSNDGSFD